MTSSSPSRDYVSALPEDVLLELFSAYSEDNASLICASHVCRLWRELIHGTPVLWKMMSLNMMASGAPNVRAAYWLDRAGEHPLTITILFPEEPEEEQPPRRKARNVMHRRTTELAMLLCRHMGRWQSLSIENIPVANLLGFLDICRGETPQLATLDIQIVEDERSSYPIAIPFGMQVETKIKTTFAHCIPLFSSSFGLRVRSIDLSINVDYATQSLLNLLNTCPNLESLDIYAHYGGLMGDTVYPVSHSHLTVLAIRGIKDIQGILNSITSSSLRKLDLDDFCWSQDMVDSFEGILQRHPSLTDVSIRAVNHVPAGAFPNTPPPPSTEPLTLANMVWFSVQRNTSPLHPLCRRVILPHVKELYLSAIPSDIVHRMVASSPHLTTLSLDELGPTSSALPMLPIPTLTRLQIEGTLDFLSYIHNIPNLLSLELAPSTNGANMLEFGTSRPFVTFLQQMLGQSHRLRGLSLKNAFISDAELISCSDSLPMLEVLAVDSCPSISDAFLRALAVGHSSNAGETQRLPRLREIRLFNNPLISSGGVLRLLTSRSALASDTNSAIRMRGIVLFDRLYNNERNNEAIRSLGMIVPFHEDDLDVYRWQSRELV
ncbi:hypothetical protein BOTBODRAFT_180711 [Botryobasidium botryosum FD-172 SS1]|uniref:F-box domain-containing protein n=1 Tax=Botryobasidium botryosum (strain FD-172 SS1) TaxID=930990 RepID=A0A067LVR0_BOTB1|nr:hypothetical protein BOTBODRAFT_180711 [Botryobasidium botryosum FD-172 SS1]